MDQPRAESRCDGCGITDDQPKHHVVIVMGDPEDLAALPPELTQTVSRHFSCCADAGCPDGSCNQILGRVA